MTLYPDMVTAGLFRQTVTVYDRVLSSLSEKIGTVVVNATQFSVTCRPIPAVKQTYGFDAFNVTHWNITLSDGSMQTVHDTREPYPNTAPYASTKFEISASGLLRIPRVPLVCTKYNLTSTAILFIIYLRTSMDEIL